MEEAFKIALMRIPDAFGIDKVKEVVFFERSLIVDVEVPPGWMTRQ